MSGQSAGRNGDILMSETNEQRAHEWQPIEKAQPPPHRVYRVWRKDVGCFDATPCYGMHAPWWVPRNGFTGEESEPIPMDDTYWTLRPYPPQTDNEVGKETR